MSHENGPSAAYNKYEDLFKSICIGLGLGTVMFYCSMKIYFSDFIARTCNVNSHARYAEAYLAAKL